MRPPRSRARAGLTAVLGALLLALLPACSRKPAPPPNVLLIVLDTVRADHLGCYGYTRRTTPSLDALAARSTRYARAWTTAPWTLSSHASILTGLHPFQHGADRYMVTSRKGDEDNARALADAHVTLAEVLLERGYATGAIVANAGYLGKSWNLDQGFETYAPKRTRAAEKVQEIQAWVGERNGRKPWFLLVNLMDTHKPYDTTPRKGLLGRPVVQDEGELLDRLQELVMHGEREFPQALAQRVIDQYDTALANQDEALGRLFAHLQETGAWENTLLIVTADHGEYFGEHRLVEHSKDVYEPVMRVPLIVKSPGQQEGKVENQAISLVDVPWMVMQAMPPAVKRHEFPYRPGNHPVMGELYYTKGEVLLDRRWRGRFDRVRTAVWDWPYKYIRSSDEQHELYHLERDPGELANLVTEKADLAASLRRALELFEKAHHDVGGRPAGAPAKITPEELEELKALGYIGDE